MRGYQFYPPSSEADWKAYHDIRRIVLFEARGSFGTYQGDHPDEYAPANHPFLLFLKAKPIGVVRIDLPESKPEAIFRRVAIALAYQKQGHGTALMREAETFASAHERHFFIANVAPDAIPFYEKIGYTLDAESPENNANSPRMTKGSRILPSSEG